MSESETDEAFKAVKLVHGNTLAIPVYWDQIEPEEGKFDFTSRGRPACQCPPIWGQVDPAVVRYLEEWQYGLCSGVGEDQSAAFQAGDITYRQGYLGAFLALPGKL